MSILAVAATRAVACWSVFLNHPLSLRRSSIAHWVVAAPMAITSCRLLLEIRLVDNLTQYLPKLPEPFKASTSGVYLGQVHHMTDGPRHYNDTINFNVIANPAGVGSLIHAFSLSLVGGALGDAGQNYKNIMMPLKAAFLQQYSIKHHYFESCPDPSVIV
jgi:hypothetical protein